MERKDFIQLEKPYITSQLQVVEFLSSNVFAQSSRPNERPESSKLEIGDRDYMIEM